MITHDELHKINAILGERKSISRAVREAETDDTAYIKINDDKNEYAMVEAKALAKLLRLQLGELDKQLTDLGYDIGSQKQD